jgi:hypothetical protein
MSTTEEPRTEEKKAVGAPPTHLGWDTHNPVVRFLLFRVGILPTSERRELLISYLRFV